MGIAVELLRPYLPPPSLSYALVLWERYPFTLRVVRPRRSRLGDYRYDAIRGHRISINADLSPPAFLLTYLHEVAHRIVHEQANHRDRPHGLMWKKTFRQLLEPILLETVFDSETLPLLRQYAHQPTATLQRHPRLAQLLRTNGVDSAMAGAVALATLPQGTCFRLNKRYFRLGPLRRTRYLCTEVNTGRRFTISAHALVWKAADFR